MSVLVLRALFQQSRLLTVLFVTDVELMVVMSKGGGEKADKVVKKFDKVEEEDNEINRF